MDIKESELISKYNWDKQELRAIRNNGDRFEGVLIWYREKSNKPAHLRTVWWTDGGVSFLTDYFKAKMVIGDFIKSEIEKINESNGVIDDKAMTKLDFNKLVNKTRWIGKVVRNSYKNNKLILVEHETGFKVVCVCKNNLLYPVNQWVIVDTLENKHSIRKQAFKLYEQAQKQKH